MTPEAVAIASASRQSELDACLEPRTVAVIGAGRSAGVGASIVRNPLATRRGGIYPVNPHARSIEEIPCYPALVEVPTSIDLAVMAVPADAVSKAVDDCIESRVADGAPLAYVALTMRCVQCHRYVARARIAAR